MRVRVRVVLCVCWEAKVGEEGRVKREVHFLIGGKPKCGTPIKQKDTAEWATTKRPHPLSPTPSLTLNNIKDRYVARRVFTARWNRDLRERERDER